MCAVKSNDQMVWVSRHVLTSGPKKQHKCIWVICVIHNCAKPFFKLALFPDDHRAAKGPCGVRDRLAG